jgi:hypothetical protein
MGGYGSMLHAIITLKNNRKLLHKRKDTLDKLRKHKHYNTLHTEYNFPKPSKPELQQIKRNIRQQAKDRKRKYVLLFLVFLLLILGFWVWWLI